MEGGSRGAEVIDERSSVHGLSTTRATPNNVGSIGNTSRLASPIYIYDNTYAENPMVDQKQLAKVSDIFIVRYIDVWMLLEYEYACHTILYWYPIVC
jgi:hypothetical protein